MKRFRVFNMDFDARVNTLIMDIKEDWKPEIKNQWEENQRSIEQGLIEEFGSSHFEIKRQNFVDLGDKPMSILAFHNRFFQQIRHAFVVGAYYPALTSACALGERILNYLVLILREDYRGTDSYKHVYRKQSFDDWDRAIDTLESWDVLLPSVCEAFRNLKGSRNRAIHFRPEVDREDRALALEAIRSLRTIISDQFGGFGLAPWFIPNTPGETFIKRECEELPFIKRVYLPNSLQVGPRHRITQMVPQILVDDDFEYESREVTDDEFRQLREDYKHESVQVSD
ncbi:MAG TPA: hypothetical protein PKK10_09315 [Woeseiaceae bacterium]|nr:hypothetical protein [Woeseiaceae bacterium]